MPNSKKFDEINRESIEATDTLYGANEKYVDSNGMMRRTPVKKNQKIFRIQHVAQWLLNENSWSDTIKLGMKAWGVSRATMEVYIREAREQLEAKAQDSMQVAATLSLTRLTDIYNKAIEDGDYKAALDVVKTQNKMLGLNAPDRAEVANVSKIDDMTLAEQVKYFGEKFEHLAEPKDDEEDTESKVVN